ncbi:squalene-hopene cyclase [Haloferula helveola]|uniref:Squalene-hopene cyclase n=1 Tax=Haloferula helveola TaxID=490095 RepID=A0ABM7R9J2_9BACT|nr:squalene-hopene cyclase [Haloferula helveola]
MSLHAQLSPEARARLAAQRRASTISSIAISLLLIVLIGLVLAFIFLPPLLKETPTIVSYSASVDDNQELETKKMTNSVERKPSAPSSSMAKVIAANTTSPTAVPVPDIDVPEPSTDFGNGDDFGDGWGSGGDGGGGGGFGNIPATMSKRCSKEDRMQRLLENGGNEQCEEAVVNALRWLQSTQAQDGSWTGSNKGAMTGFALLAFLGHCETPVSEEFGETVTDAIIYLVDLGMKNDGRLATADVKSHHWVYEHGIATYALAEAYTFCHQLKINIPNLGEVTRKAGDMIIKGQGDRGGWVYGYAGGNGGDNSVGFWQIQALKACKHTGLWDSGAFKKVSRKALDWLSEVQGSNGAIGYRGNPGQSPGLTGGGVLAFQMWDEGKSKEARAGIKYIKESAKFDWNDDSSNLYYHYYNAQAMINYGGVAWKEYNDMFRDTLLEKQGADGSWNRGRKIKHGAVNVHMSTCLATFMLEVYYRFLPATGAGVK